MNKIPGPGELYRHYTGGIYQILTIARHSETNEQLVVLQAMYGTFETYASPLSQFTSEVDHQKYPRIKQQYWFSQIDKTQLAGQQGTVQEMDLAGQQEPVQEMNLAGQAEQQKANVRGKTAERPATRSPAESRRAFREGGGPASNIESSYQQKLRRQIADRESRREQFLKPQKRESAADELRANPCLMKFLDADTYEAKYRVLTEIQEEMTDRLIDDMAVVLDVVIPEGPLNDRYCQLRNIILTRQKYEKTRYR